MESRLVFRFHPAAGVVIFIVALTLRLTPTAAAAEDFHRIIVSVDMTPQGRKIAPPNPGNPTYYLPLYNGYIERGDILKFYVRKPVDELSIRRSLIETLRQQGYLPATKRFPPTLVLAFRWGTVAPEKISGQVLNEAEMDTYTLGEAVKDVNRYTANGRELLQTDIARHFVMITALDLPAFLQHKDVVLWRAHVSNAAWGEFLDEVLPTLVTAVAPSLGRETKAGVFSTDAVIPVGHVSLGQALVVDHPVSEKTK